MSRTREQNEAAINRAESARVALADGVIADAFRDIELSAIARSKASVTPEDAFQAALTLQITEQVFRVLKAYVADGKRAASDLEDSLVRARQKRSAERDHANYLTAAHHARAEFDRLTAANHEEATHV